MKVENITGYGKGFVDLLSSPESKVIGKIQTKMIGKVLWKEFGFMRMMKLGWILFREKKKMKHHNWSAIEKHGFPLSGIQMILYPILLMKVLTDVAGIERAQEIVSKILDKTEEEFVLKKLAFNSFGLQIEELKACDDPFISFKTLLKVTQNIFEEEGLHKIEIETDTEDTLAYNMTYCAANEISKECGNSAFCFPWCYLDEATFPGAGAQLGFKFDRPENLSGGASKCNFSFTRI